MSGVGAARSAWSCGSTIAPWPIWDWGAAKLNLWFALGGTLRTKLPCRSGAYTAPPQDDKSSERNHLPHPPLLLSRLMRIRAKATTREDNYNGHHKQFSPGLAAPVRVRRQPR